MSHARLNLTYCITVVAIFCLPCGNSYGFQATSGASGYALLPSISCLEKGEVLFSTWGSYITSDEFKWIGIFPLSFATGVSKRGEGFLTFSGPTGFTDFDSGITKGFKWNIYNSNSVYPSAGILIESYNMETSPDARISLILERALPWRFTTLLSAGYAAGKRERRGATGSWGFVYGKGFPRVVFGAKTLANGKVNTVFISGIFRIIDKLFLNIISGHTFSQMKVNFVTLGFTLSVLKEKVVPQVEAIPQPDIVKPPEKRIFQSPVPEFRLKLK